MSDEDWRLEGEVPAGRRSVDEGRPPANFDQLRLAEYLDSDPRPAFVVDLDKPSRRPCFLNAALRHDHMLLSAVTDRDPVFLTGPSVTQFRQWIADGRASFSPFSFANTQWICITIRKRWRIVQSDGSAALRDGRTQSLAPASSNTSSRRSSVSRATSIPTDMPAQQAVKAAEPIRRDIETRSLAWHDFITNPENASSPFYDFMAQVDWEHTCLGPMSQWSSILRSTVQVVMSNPKPTALIWGPERRMIYNEAYTEICGSKHPDAMGATFWEVYPEVTNFDKLFEQAEASRQGIAYKDCLYFIERRSFIEETYFSFSFIPIFDGDDFVGLYNPTWETTATVIESRRMRTVMKIADTIVAPRDLANFWEKTVTGFDHNENDFPFASIYSVVVSDDATAPASSPGDGAPTIRQYKFEGASAVVPEGHILAAPLGENDRRNELLIDLMRKVAKTGNPLVLHAADRSLDPRLVEGIRCPPFDDPCNSLVIYPVRSTKTASNVGGFAILGLNPRVPYDVTYSRFVDLVMQQLGTSLASAILLEEEARRSAMEQAQLEQELIKTSAKAKKAAMQFEQFAASAPIGINVFDLEGKILYANDVWYELTQVPRNAKGPEDWMHAFVPEELARIGGLWEDLIVRHKPITFETKLNKPWCPPTGGDGECLPYTWIWASAYLEQDSDASDQVVVGCFKDISQQKYVEEIQTQRMNDAIEAKRLQESFIDMTSHELRNPLSAVVHAADGIISLLSKDLETPVETSELSADAVASSLEAAKSIIHCSLHQKRIADDILTASKLDSNLLPVSPDRVRITDVVRNALRMFEGEMHSAAIECSFAVDPSIERLSVEYVYVDPSRLTQIFVNLLANAIKFTQAETEKSIRLRVGASVEKYHDAFAVKYVPPVDPVSPTSQRPRPRRDLTNHPDWGSGEPIYLHFAVTDTGRGLSEAERDLLFRRFSQATPRTHVQYGGSGLGLFISRELTELQGGEIGVASEPGQGSTFAFYVKARRASPPELQIPDGQPGETLRQRASSNVSSFDSMSTSPSMSLPVRGPLLTPNDSATASPKEKASIRKSERSSAASKAKRDDGFSVLYVEDNLVNRKVLSKQLRMLGFTVYEANHGEEALSFLKETRWWKPETASCHAAPQGESQVADLTLDVSAHRTASQADTPPTTDAAGNPPAALEIPSLANGSATTTTTTTAHSGLDPPKDLHVILMDLEMPVMDGLTCMRHIRQLQRTGQICAHIPTIAVTANARKEQMDDALATGMDSIVSKPFRLPELVRRMEDVVAQLGGLRPVQ